MQRPSFTDFDRPYRRGVVLGLSLAELFILLIFLLLLTMIGYAMNKEQELAEQIKQQEHLDKTVNELKDQLTKAENEKERAEQEKEEAENQLRSQIKDHDPNDLIVALEKISSLTTQVNDLQDDLQPDQKESNAPKGQDSPCWYEMTKRSNGEDYEKALYIFSIRISDRHIFVKDIDAPTLEYQKQKKELEFDRTALNKDLDYADFARAFQPLKQSGDNKKVRDDRRCTFYIRMWDATTSKSSYKRAHNEFVQGVFNTYEVKDNPWRH